VRRTVFALILLAGCKHGDSQHEYPKLGDDAPDPRATPGGHSGGKESEPIASVPVLFEPTGSACMPTGVYDVTFDLSGAKISVVGEDEEFCRSWLMGVPTELLGQMKIAVETGALAIYWPGKMTVLATSACEFMITSQPVHGKFSFIDGAGTGVGDYAVGSPNHPNEKCEAKGAKIRLVRASS